MNELEQALSTVPPEQADEYRLLVETFAPEPLDDELESYVDETDTGLVCLRHPLVYSIPYAEHLNRILNQQLRYKQQALKRALAHRDWHTVIFLHERPWRLDALLQIQGRMGPRQYWETVESVWTDSENIADNEEEWRIALASPYSCRWAIMDKTERRTLKALPDLVPVYRGARFPDAARDGLSWTTLPDTAHWFAHRWGREGDEPTVAEGYVERPKIIACFDGRGEHEVVALPEDVTISRLIPAQRVER